MIDKAKAQPLLNILAVSKRPPWRPIASRDLSRLLGVSLQSLANWRVRGSGPEPEPHKRGQGNRIYYRPDKVMAWLSALCGTPHEDWQFCHEWLIAQGLSNMEARPEVVWCFTQFADKHGYFGGNQNRTSLR